MLDEIFGFWPPFVGPQSPQAGLQDSLAAASAVGAVGTASVIVGSRRARAASCGTPPRTLAPSIATACSVRSASGRRARAIASMAVPGISASGPWRHRLDRRPACGRGCAHGRAHTAAGGDRRRRPGSRTGVTEPGRAPRLPAPSGRRRRRRGLLLRPTARAPRGDEGRCFGLFTFLSGDAEAERVKAMPARERADGPAR